MHSLNDLRLRSNPLIELTPLASLGDQEREPFRELEADPDFYGLFVARPPLAMTVKTAGRETAELFQSLAQPARIDRALLDDEESVADLIDLVLDGILEIESGREFVSGADALAVLAPAVRTPEGRGAAGRLSIEALLQAQELKTSDPLALSMELYRFNHIPISPFWRARFPSSAAVLAHVGADRGALRSILEGGWTFSEPSNAWLYWRSALVPPQRDGDEATYKLYVSPRPESIRDAFHALVRVLTAIPASFKLGNRAAGLLRPDKLVAYFASREQLGEAAAMLQRELAGCDAHGVPFTAGLDEHGLLSWGVDPPETDRVLRWLQRNSWRLWIAQRLGGALAIAKRARTAPAVEPWRFAVARMERLGVNVETWTPSAALWRLP